MTGARWCAWRFDGFFCKSSSSASGDSTDSACDMLRLPLPERERDSECFLDFVLLSGSRGGGGGGGGGGDIATVCGGSTAVG